MSWVIRTKSGKTLPVDDFDGISDREMAIVLIQTTNSFGKEVFAYIELPVKRTKDLILKMASGERFMPSDFGAVLAAGLGEPSQELQDEMGPDLYSVTFDKPKLPNIFAKPKKWD